MVKKLRFSSTMVGIFLILTMLFSTFAYVILQSFNSGQGAQLPETNVIDYRLDPNVKNYLIQSGATVMTFEYNLGCENCIDQKALLEFFAKEFNQQLFLEEVINGTLDVSEVTINSLYGKRELINANETGVFSGLCELMVAPPTECVLV